MLKLGMPSLCVINGNAVAGGILHAWSHDHIVMRNEPKTSVCLSEILSGMQIPYSILLYAMHFFPKGTTGLLVTGARLNPQEAYNMNLVHELYSSVPEIEARIQLFAKEKARLNSRSHVLSSQKRLMHKDLLNVLDNVEFYGMLSLPSMGTLAERAAKL